jgi:hypothetical protein
MTAVRLAAACMLLRNAVDRANAVNQGPFQRRRPG